MNVFRGKKYLTLEKYPDYVTGGKYPSFKIKTLLDLGFTKLVLRIRATGYRARAVELAEMAFPTVTHNLVSNINEPHGKTEMVGFSRLYCYNYEGDLMGELSEFRHWFKYDIVCSKDCPKHVLYARNLDKYVGWSHRAAQFFGIGDMLFDENWKPSSGFQSESEISEYLSNLPFVQRGEKVIETKTEAIKAARNFAIYVS
jgi:hypothetical protein